jgi:hypothetical protein
MIETAQKILNLNATLSPIVEGRVWLSFRPQNERRPGVVLRLTGTDRAHTFDGEGGYEQGTFAADCLAPDYATANWLAVAVAGALDNFSGEVDGVSLDYIEADGMNDIPMLPLAGKAEPTYGVSVELSYQVQR